MHHIIRVVTYVGLLCVSMLSSVFAEPVVNIEHWQTDNGLRVYFVKSPQLPILDIRLAFAAGSAHDGKVPGLASLTNRLIGETTSKHNADAIADGFDNVGAILTHSIGHDQALIALRTLADSKMLSDTLSLFNDVVADATFPQATVKRVKQQALIDLQQDNQDPNTVANDALYQALYQHTVYAHPVAGTTKGIFGITPKQIKQFYKHYYVAENAVLVMVGDISQQQAKDIANQLAQRLPKGKAAAPVATVKATTTAQQKTIAFPASQTTIRLGQVGINYNDPNYFPLYVGNFVLGGGLASRLFDTVRVKNGLAYGVYSYFAMLQANGPFMITLQTRNQAAQQALALSQLVLSDFVESGPSPEELNTAKQNITGSFALRFSSNNAIADNVLRLAFYQLPLNYFDTFRDKINAVTIQDVQRAFEETVNLNALTTITVGEIIKESA